MSQGVLKVVMQSTWYVLTEGQTSLILGRGEEDEVGSAQETKAGKKLVRDSSSLKT
jgi:hypothetical protein